MFVSNMDGLDVHIHRVGLEEENKKQKDQISSHIAGNRRILETQEERLQCSRHACRSKGEYSPRFEQRYGNVTARVCQTSSVDKTVRL